MSSNHFLAFDLESQRDAKSVGGWDNISDMKMSVGVVWNSLKNDFFVYYENQVHDLIQHLMSGPRVIGYNHLYFDYTVLSGYAKDQDKNKLLQTLKQQKNLDLMLDLKSRLGFRLKLDSLVRATLEMGKSADGLQALIWYQEYLAGDPEKLIKIMEYCKQDVAVTRDLYLYGLKHREVSYETKWGIKSTAVNWEETAPKKLEVAEQLSF